MEELRAVQLTWSNWSAICDFVPRPWFETGTWIDKDGFPTQDVRFTTDSVGLIMRDRQGNAMIARAGDWIVRMPNGDYYIQRPV